MNLTELDGTCRRVMGVLLEKELTTPDYYPLTLNSLISACNQTTNRNPVMVLKRHEVLAALHLLGRQGLVQRVAGPRADRWSHLLIQPVLNRPPNKALLTVLLLRGTQTLGELKSRTRRMYEFRSLEELETTLRGLLKENPPLVRQMQKEPGQKEPRWALILPDEETSETPVTESEMGINDSADSLSLEARVERLEQQVGEILKRLES